MQNDEERRKIVNLPDDLKDAIKNHPELNWDSICGSSGSRHGDENTMKNSKVDRVIHIDGAKTVIDFSNSTIILCGNDTDAVQAFRNKLNTKE